jgi:hypothetical protein
MLCPQKVLRMNEFSRDIINGIIWDQIKEKKTHPAVLFKMGMQQAVGLKMTVESIKEKALRKLDNELDIEKNGANNQRLERFNEMKQIEKDSLIHKDLFITSQRKQQFF